MSKHNKSLEMARGHVKGEIDDKEEGWCSLAETRIDMYEEECDD